MANPYDDEDRRQAMTQGLLAAGLAALGARRGQEGTAFAQAGLLGLGGYNRSLESSTEARDRTAMREQQQLVFEQQQEELMRKRQEQAALEQARLGAFTGGMPAMGPPTSGGEMQPPVAPQFNREAYARNLEAVNPQAGLAYQQAIAKPTKEVKETRTLTLDGKRVTVNIYKDGTQEVLPFAPDMEKPHFVSTADKTGVPLDPWTGKPLGSGVAMGVSPADAQRIGLDQARFGLEKQKFGYQKEQDAAKTAGGNAQWDAASGQWITRPSPDNPTGSAVSPSGFNKPDKPLTESQAKATAYVQMMRGANGVLEDLGKKGFTGEGVVQQGAIVAAGSEGIPYVPGSGIVTRASAGKHAQQYQAAELQWTEPVLRFLTGANAPTSEVVRNAATFFPRPGDPPAVVEQKRAARDAMEQAIVMAAGPNGERALEQAKKIRDSIGGGASVQSSDTLPPLGNLPEGATVTDNQTGIKLRKKNGKWERL
jgi:hypothetical protein